MVEVECMKSMREGKECSVDEFNTEEEALAYAEVMLKHYGYTVWVDGTKLFRKDFRHGA